MNDFAARYGRRGAQRLQALLLAVVLLCAVQRLLAASEVSNFQA